MISPQFSFPHHSTFSYFLMDQQTHNSCVMDQQTHNSCGPQGFWNLYHAQTAVDWILEPTTELCEVLFPSQASCDLACEVLEIGAGTSTLSDLLARSRPNFKVLSTDVSHVAISQAQARDPAPPSNLTYAVLDAIEPNITSISADVVLDKGCLDTFLFRLKVRNREERYDEAKRTLENATSRSSLTQKQNTSLLATRFARVEDTP
jgi:SAM-dependent methyltransferase